MTREELIGKIDHGDDIMFNVLGRHYAIFTWAIDEDGICICEQNVPESERYFKTAYELVDNYSIDHLTLASLVDQIKITDYTLALY